MIQNLVYLADLTATQQLAQKLAPHLRSGDALALDGSLGAGKTTFARALLEALGVTGEVPSPTFTLLQTYELPNLTIAHFDLYRLKSADELEELGWDDLLSDHLALIEWPERAQGHLPDDCLTIHFTLDETGKRSCRLEGSGRWIDRMKDIA